MSLLPKRSARRALCGIVLSAVAFMAGCSSSNRKSDAVSTGVGVTLTTAGGVVGIQAGETLVLTATVANDTNSAGVTWQLTGPGTLTNISTTSATYTGPTPVSGAVRPYIVATSITDTTKNGSVTLIVNGDPIFATSAYFPANVNSNYSAPLTVIGGKSPYTWAVVDTTKLPPGMSLAASTLSTTAVSGTPTATGSYTFDIKVTDSATTPRSITKSITLQVNPATACVLDGRFAFIESGVVSGVAATRAGSLAISNGAVTGVMDHREGTSTDTEASLTGTCGILAANSGLLKLTGSVDSPTFSYAINLPLTRGRLQLTSGGTTITGSGSFERQDSSAFSVAALGGTFAFGLLGSEADGRPLALAGHITVAADGSVIGTMDGNGSSALDAAAVTGTLGAPATDSGRGTLTLNAGSQTFNLLYYVVNANRLLLVAGDSAATAPRLSGYATRSTGSFSAASLATPAILSLWGSAHTSTPTAVMQLTRLSNASTSLQTVDLLTDTFDRTTNTLLQKVTGATTTVGADGRATVSATSGGKTRQYVVHLYGDSSGYAVETGSGFGSGGMLEAQLLQSPSGTMSGFLLLGTEHPEGTAPVVLLAATAFVSGSLSGSAGTGAYAVDTITGRALGVLNFTLDGSATSVLYQLDDHKAVVMRAGSASANPTMNWLQD